MLLKAQEIYTLGRKPTLSEDVACNLLKVKPWFVSSFATCGGLKGQYSSLFDAYIVHFDADVCSFQQDTAGTTCTHLHRRGE